MKKDGEQVRFSRREQALAGLPEAIPLDVVPNYVIEIQETRCEIYRAANHPSPPGFETDARYGATVHADDLGMLAIELARVGGFTFP